MSLIINTTTKINDAAEFVAISIINHLKKGECVLFFVTGGSSVFVGVQISEIFKNYSDQNIFSNLVVTLTDERYGDVNHTDSNWFKLIKNGFNISQARSIPILTGDDHDITTEKFNTNLEKEFKDADYKIGLFGIGSDGHTAGILPESVAAECNGLVCGYDSATFSRITMTFKAIEKLDEVVVWMQGEDKWKVIKDLEEKNIDLKKQPAQILKKVPLLTFFTDYKKP